MQPRHDRTKIGSLAWRSLILPAAASGLVALGLGMGFSCDAGPGAWLLLAAPVFALVGAVGGPEAAAGPRIVIGLISTALNMFVMVGMGMGFAGMNCRF